MFQLQTPTDFNFHNVIRSHGWSNLAPFALDVKNLRLQRNFGKVSSVVFEHKGEILVETNEKITSEQQAEISRAWRHILRLDEDFTEFYALLDEFPEFRWIAEKGAGRLLRSPTVFEDLIKTICTTNCSWALTLKMTANIVGEIGKGSFPSAVEMACFDTDFYRTRIRAGYRAQFLQNVAASVADKSLDVEAWLNAGVPTIELKKAIKQVKGCGEYAADNLLKLVGHYDVLALDSWLRSRFYRMRNNGVKCADSQIADFYSRFGKWRGLVIWCDLSRDRLQ